MRLTCNRNELLHAMAACGPAVAKRTTKPILQNVKMTAKGDGVTLHATNCEIGITHHLDAEVAEWGECLLPYDKVKRLLADSTAERVSFAQDGKCVHLTEGRGKFRIETEDAAEFPPLEAVTEGEVCTVEAATLKLAIGRVVEFTDDTSVNAMRGVLFQIANAELHIVATDERVLGACKLPCRYSGPDVRFNATEDFCRAVSQAPDGPLEMRFSENAVTAKGSVCTVAGRQLSGMFPRWERIIRKQSQATAVVKCTEFAAALKQASLFTGVDAGTLGVTLLFGDNAVQITSGVGGSSDVSLPISYSGSPVRIMFNPVHVLRVLRSAKDQESLEFQIEDYEQSVVSVWADSVFLVMPIVLEKEKK